MTPAGASVGLFFFYTESLSTNRRYGPEDGEPGIVPEPMSPICLSAVSGGLGAGTCRVPVLRRSLVPLRISGMEGPDDRSRILDCGRLVDAGKPSIEAKDSSLMEGGASPSGVGGLPYPSLNAREVLLASDGTRPCQASSQSPARMMAQIPTPTPSPTLILKKYGSPRLPYWLVKEPMM